MHEPILLQIAIMLAAAKLGGELCERWLKQPAVLGEIVFGVLAGQSVFGWVQGDSLTLQQIAEIGAVLLLFEVGLESDLEDLFKVGLAATWVAVAGVALPFLMGFFVARGLGHPPIQSLFVGAALTATSVGITARVFSDLNALHTKEAKIVLGAAVVDDVIGLIILAAVSGLAASKAVSWLAVAKLTLMAYLFLAGALILGLRATPLLLHWARRMRTRAAVPSVAVIFCLLLATLAETAQLAPIVGAFAAGLVLAKTEHKVHFEEQVKSIADIFVPIFFVMMGARMNLQVFDPTTAAGRTTLTIGGLLFVVALIGKVLGGLSVPGRGTKRWTVGIGMIPRGEVGLIFASIGLSKHVINDALYAAIILVVILTTFITPPLLKLAASRPGPKGGVQPAQRPESPLQATGEPLAETP
ncbi:MAG TPA: cation:proton antiporter [Chthonomonadaceae bacterium]|nr:cation:proton antiporter [Chthonomonadaceae bacterium]